MHFPWINRRPVTQARKPERMDHDVNTPLLSDQDIAEITYYARALDSGTRLSTHALRGEQSSRFRGSGLDFEDLRPYQPGDDPRRIDWRASARLRKPFVRLYAETRLATTWIVLDRGASMRFGTRIRLKVAQAARLGSLIAAQASAGQHALGYTLLDGEQALHHAPRNGRSGLLQLIHALRMPCGRAHDSAGSRWEDALSTLEITLPKGTQLWLISDFLQLRAQDERLLERLAAHSAVRLALIEDASELELPHLGMVELQTNAGTQLLDTSAQHIQSAYRQAHAARLAHLHALAMRLGGTLLTCHAGDDLPHIAQQLAQITP